VEELKQETLLSPASSLRVVSPLALAPLKTRLQHAELAADQNVQDHRSVDDTADDPPLSNAGQKDAYLPETPQQHAAGWMEDSVMSSASALLDEDTSKSQAVSDLVESNAAETEHAIIKASASDSINASIWPGLEAETSWPTESEMELNEITPSQQAASSEEMGTHTTPCSTADNPNDTMVQEAASHEAQDLQEQAEEESTGQETVQADALDCIEASQHIPTSMPSAAAELAPNPESQTSDTQTVEAASRADDTASLELPQATEYPAESEVHGKPEANAEVEATAVASASQAAASVRRVSQAVLQAKRGTSSSSSSSSKLLHGRKAQQSRPFKKPGKSSASQSHFIGANHMDEHIQQAALDALVQQILESEAVVQLRAEKAVQQNNKVAIVESSRSSDDISVGYLWESENGNTEHFTSNAHELPENISAVSTSCLTQQLKSTAAETISAASVQTPAPMILGNIPTEGVKGNGSRPGQPNVCRAGTCNPHAAIEQSDGLAQSESVHADREHIAAAGLEVAPEHRRSDADMNVLKTGFPIIPPQPPRTTLRPAEAHLWNANLMPAIPVFRQVKFALNQCKFMQHSTFQSMFQL
jgi:hypothetical protein